MESKKSFTQSEDFQLEELFKQKASASSSEKKSIRAKMRKLGFYCSDYGNDIDLNFYRNLKKRGEITIEGDCRIIRKSPCNIVREVRSIITPKRKGPCENINFKEGLAPLVGEDPRVLVLGTLPGDESIKRQAYYSNPRNQFWKILDSIAHRREGQSNEEFAKEIGIALWDCCHSAVRKGSSDDGFEKSTEVPNDLEQFLKKYPSIEVVVLNGTGKTTDCYNRFFNSIDAPRVLSLISTSSAAGVKLEDKIRDWSIIKKWLKKA